jgi:hypothetical protein
MKYFDIAGLHNIRLQRKDQPFNHHIISKANTNPISKRKFTLKVIQKTHGKHLHTLHHGEDLVRQREEGIPRPLFIVGGAT